MNMTDRDFVMRLAVLLVAVTFAPISFAQERILEGNDEAQAAAREKLIPQLVDGHFDLPSMMAPTIATDEIGNGRLPEGFRGEGEQPVQPLPESGSDRGEAWNWTVANWTAPNTYSYPRYYEDRMLERHGHERCGHLQPLASGARFFATVPMLPYLMTLRHPCDCEYTLGYYRPGTRAPGLLQRPPCDRRAMIAEGAAIAAVVVAFP